MTSAMRIKNCLEVRRKCREIAKALGDAWAAACNARQCMAKIKGAFGQGELPEFPEEVAGDAPPRINVYGDGSLKCPASQWWALGGFGVWWPGAKDDAEFRGSMLSTRLAHVEENAIGVGVWNCMKGQFGSSTRMELGAWVMALTREIPVHMGTDSESRS